MRSRRRAWHWRAPPGAAGPAPLVLRARGQGAPPGRAGSNQTWSRGQLTRAAGVGPVRPVWAQSLPMRQGMRGERGQSRNRGADGAGPPRSSGPTAQAPRAPPAAPQRPPRRRGGGRRVRKPGLEGRGRLVRTVVPRSLRARGFSQRPGSGSAGPFPPDPGLGRPGAELPGPGGAGARARGGASRWGRRGLSRAAAQAGPRALPRRRLPQFPGLRARAPRCPSLGHLLTCTALTLEWWVTLKGRR